MRCFRAASSAITAASILMFVPGAAAADLSLNDAVARSLASSPRLRQAEFDYQSQVEKHRSSWADVGPRVNFDYAMTQFNDAQMAGFGGQSFVTRPKITKDASLTATQPITGAFALAEKAGLDGTLADLKELTLRQTEAEVAFGAAEYWLRASEKAKLTKVAEDSVAAAEKQRHDGAALERAGRINRGDLLKLELAVSEAKARTAGARAAEEVALAQLGEAVALAPDEKIALPASAGSETFDGDQPLTSDVKAAMGKRLDPRLADLSVEAAGFGKKLAYAAFSPSINVFVKWDRNLGEIGALGSAQRDTHMIGVNASWALWDNGSRIFAVRAAANDTAKAEAVRDQVLQGVRLELTAASSMLKAARESLTLAMTAVQQAEEAYRIEQARFNTGTRSATDLILAEASRSGAQGRLVSAKTDYLVARMKMRKAVGELRPVPAGAQAKPVTTAPDTAPSQGAQPAPGAAAADSL